MKIKNVLLPVEDTELCKKTCAIAGGIAKAFGSEIMILHVIDEANLNRKDIVSEEYEALKKNLEERGKKAIRYAEKMLKGKNLKFKSVMKLGIPHEEIIKTAKEERADLIIIGSHGRHGLRKILEGSVTEKTVDSAPCPVLVLH